MIWFTIALFFISFLVTALLAPKPEFENARAGSLDDVQFPRATEDAPIPLVLGKVRMNAPNTLWYGDWLTVPITERVKTGLFSKTTIVVGHEYYLGLDLGISLGPSVHLREVWIDEENVWTGDLGGTGLPEIGTIEARGLFGGYKAGGGWEGGFTWYPGAFPQAVSTYVEGVVGAGEVPGYGGMAHLVFHQNYIGEANQLRKMAFTVSKYTNDLGTINSGRVGTDDMNPMEALYQILVNDWGGLGVGVGDIDTANWIAVAETLYNEGNGVSVIVTSAQNGKQIVGEILRQIDGILYQVPETGKLAIKLIRDDYDPDLLPVYDEDDIVMVRSMTKTTWEDVVGQVKVSYPQRDKESSAVAISIDSATANMIGRLKTVNMSFPFCYDPSLANKLASRERAQQSVPLFRMTLEMTRNAYNLQPGDPFKVSWPEYGLEELVMRVQKHDLGQLLNGKIVLDCIQDAFAVGTTVFADPEGSGWVAPSTLPTDIVTWLELNAPTFFSRILGVPAGNSQPLVLPLRPQTESSSFSMIGGTVSGTLEIAEPYLATYPATGTLTAAYDREEGQLTGVDTTTGFTVTSRLGLFEEPVDTADIYGGELGILYVDGEYIGFENVTNNPSTAVFTNVHRGLFGSSVKDHALGTRVYQLDTAFFGTGIAGGDLTEGSTFYFKILDAVGANQQYPTDVTEQSFVMDDTLRKPLRPRNLQLATQRSPAYVVDGTSDLSASWSATDRETGALFPTETAAAEVPPETTTYDIRVYVNGAEVVSLAATNQAGSSYSIPFTSLVGEYVGPGEIRVWARREDPDNPGVDPDYLSDGYASLTFDCNIALDELLLSGDMQSGTDKLLTSGDMQSGTDVIDLEGDMG